jgi:hypothetical protein
VEVTWRDNVLKELARVEEDCEVSSKSQFNAADRWSRYHIMIGLPAVILAAAAGAAFLKAYSDIASAISLVVAILTAAQTFLKPGERGQSHKSAGDQYLALKTQTRIYRTIGYFRDDEAAIASKLNDIDDQRRALNTAAPIPAPRDFRRAQKGIALGEATHRVDGRS